MIATCQGVLALGHDDTLTSRPRAALVLLAAGSGSRVGHEANKAFLPLAGRSVFSWSLRSVGKVPEVVRILLVIAERDRSLAESLLAREAAVTDVELVVGGNTRHESEWRALEALAKEIRDDELDIIVIHDAARPLAGSTVFADVIVEADAHGGALPVRPQPALISVTGEGSPARDIVTAQTPQAFRAAPLLEAYERAHDEGFVGTDTASCIERLTTVQVRGVPGSAQNIKITFPEDLLLAEHCLAEHCLAEQLPAALPAPGPPINAP